MKQIAITGKSRVTGKKSDTKQIRRNEEVPCVLYGPGVENVLFNITMKELKTITHSPNSYIINLDIDGKSYLAIFHQIQYHPVSDAPLHVDFLAISKDKPVTIDIPVEVSGNSEGVKQGGKLMIETRKLRVMGLIKDLPDVLPIDITELKLGKQVYAGALSYKNIQILTSKTSVVCAVKMTRAAIGAAAAAAAEGVKS